MGPVWLRVALAPVLFLATLMLVTAPLALVEQPLQGASYGVLLAVLVTAHLAVTLACLGVLWLLARFVQRCRLGDLGIRWTRRSLPLLGLGVLASVLITVPLGLVLQQAGLLRPTPAADGVPGWAQVGLALSAGFLLQGIPEEWFFRGWLLRVLGDRPVRAVWISAAVFGSLHLVSSGGQENLLERAVYVAMATGFGLSAGALAVATRSVWTAIGIHAGFHVANLAAGGLGVGQGPWLWGTVAVGHLVLALVLLRRSDLGPHLPRVLFEY